MSDIQTKPVRFKKRYIAIVALAGLVATGGIVGATVTAQTTIANNTITVKSAEVINMTATGSPVKATFTKRGTDTVAVDEGKQVWVLENTGNVDITVKALPVTGVTIPGIESDSVTFGIGNKTGDRDLLYQGLGAGAATPTAKTFTLTPGEKKSVYAQVDYRNQADLIPNLTAPAEYKFDLKFDFVKKAS